MITKEDAVDLECWFVQAAGCLVGNKEGQVRQIRTSRIVSRDDNVITTQSGSRYRLSGTAHPLIESGAWTASYGDRWGLLDNHIAANRRLLSLPSQQSNAN